MLPATPWFRPMRPSRACDIDITCRNPICAGLSRRRSERLFVFLLRTLKRSLARRLTESLARSNMAAAKASSADQPSLRAMVARIEVRNSHLALWLMHPGQEGADETTAFDRRKRRAVDPLDEAAGQEVQGDPASSLD